MRPHVPFDGGNGGEGRGGGRGDDGGGKEKGRGRGGILMRIEDRWRGGCGRWRQMERRVWDIVCLMRKKIGRIRPTGQQEKGQEVGMVDGTDEERMIKERRGHDEMMFDSAYDHAVADFLLGSLLEQEERLLP